MNDDMDDMYVPPGEWPVEAWDELLDRYFEKTIDTPDAPATHQYVLLRIPVDEWDRRVEARAAGRSAPRQG